MEEEAGADAGTHGPGDEARAQPAQDAPQHKHRVSPHKHHQGRVPPCRPEVLHDHLRSPAVSSWLMRGLIPVIYLQPVSA